jgi:hypothetical protein
MEQVQVGIHGPDPPLVVDELFKVGEEGDLLPLT